MDTPTVWFNKNLSSVFNAIETIRSHGGDPIRIVCSHSCNDFPASIVSDLFVQEPKGLVGPGYVEFCLDFARAHEVTLFVPGKELQSIVQERGRFEAAGVKVLAAADADTLHLLEDKARLYRSLEPGIVAIPDFEVVNDLAGFDAAVERLGGQHQLLCFKPSISLFGLGFRIITEGGSSLERLLAGEAVKIGLAEARTVLGQTPRFRDVMVMQYLPGPERSVDCLARAGELVTSVVRRKSSEGSSQFLEENPALEEIIRRLTAKLRLDGMFNIQFRDSEGISYLLEINPRMSGGLHYSCLSGVAFPYWAIRLALGTGAPADIPKPRTGLRVGQTNRAICL